jgi:H/ACA ribonucleoprotein complex subunit 3
MLMALRRCTACSEYTLEPECKHCGGTTERAGPAKYSPEDRYGPYRRALKKEAGQDRP